MRRGTGAGLALLCVLGACSPSIQLASTDEPGPGLVGGLFDADADDCPVTGADLMDLGGASRSVRE